ncbi:MAG: hypothetical protein ACQCN6_01800 [Candidatus Bathyarchaeia archaeon]|jgi:hypothetical protein
MSSASYLEWFTFTIQKGHAIAEFHEKREWDFKRCLRHEINNNIAAKISLLLILCAQDHPEGQRRFGRWNNRHCACAWEDYDVNVKKSRRFLRVA